MKMAATKRSHSANGRFRFARCLLILALAWSFQVPAGLAAVTIWSPYAGVDWSTFGQHKGNLHTHTTQSDGNASPAAMIDAYHTLGYSILAITDHNTSTWSWQDYGRDPAALGMIAVRGCEPSRHHHMGSYFNDYNGSSSNVHTSLQMIGDNDGLAVMFHPGRYSESVSWYTNLYETYDHLVGMEVYNQGDRYSGDRALWDQVLTQLMPHTPVWGFSNDDAHNATNHVGRNWQTFLLPELTEGAVRSAMENGQFYFSYAPTGGNPAPVIDAITVDEGAGTITIDASGYTGISWIAGGAVIATGSATLDVSAHQGYVRAELTGPTGKSYTQPFFVGDPDGGTPVPWGISVGPDGAPVQMFPSRPTTADGWSTVSISGGAGDLTTVAALDARVQTLSADGITTQVGSSGTWRPSTHVLARWNSSRELIQTRPSGNAATVLMATLQNNTGDVVDNLHIWYDFGSWLRLENEHIHGHRTFYSLTGDANDWHLIPEFSTFSQTSAEGEMRVSASLSLGAWAPGAPLYLLWADDNGPGGSDNSGTGREGAYTINNFNVTPKAPPAWAIPVDFGGVPAHAFTSRPSIEDGWSTYSIPGSPDAGMTPEAFDAIVQGLAASDVAWLVGQSGTWVPSTHGLARWNSTQQLLQTRPTGNAGTAVMATLWNESGCALTSIDVSFDFGLWNSAVEQVYGYRTFFSLTGEPDSWELIPEFSEFSQTSQTGETELSATLTFNSAWAPNTPLYILWADHNASGGTEGAYTINNFAVTNVVPEPTAWLLLLSALACGLLVRRRK